MDEQEGEAGGELGVGDGEGEGGVIRCRCSRCSASLASCCSAAATAVSWRCCNRGAAVATVIGGASTE
jgi:hypothetical protein